MTIIGILAETLAPVPGIELAVLFGSAARGQAGPRSDLDVAIGWRPGVEPPLDLEVRLGRATRREVSVLALNDAPPLLRREIARDGLVLIASDPHTWTRFRAQAMIDWWDWAPTVRMMHHTMARRLREEALRGHA